MLSSISEASTARAIAQNMTWPFVTIPTFSVFASSALHQTQGIEGIAVNPIVQLDPTELDAYANFVRETYQEWIVRSHELYYGHTDKLNQSLDNLTPEVRPIPEPEKYGNLPYALPLWLNFPPPFSYAGISWNLIQRAEERTPVEALMKLYNYTTASMRLPLLLEVEQHELMHSKLPNTSVEFPHSFLYHPIYRDPWREDNTPDSNPIVGVVTASVAWDASMKNLMPKNIPLTAILKNTCNQSYTFDIEGSEAYFVADGDKHDPAYSSFRKTADLSNIPETNRETVDGDCRYSLVRKIAGV